MPDAFSYHRLIFDSEGNPIDALFLEVNAAFEEITGLTRDKVVGKKVSEIKFGFGESGLDWVGIYAEAALSGEEIRFEKHFEQIDRWFAVTLYIDEPEHFAVIFHETTEQTRNRQALEHSHDLMRYIIEHNRSAVAVHDRDMKYLYVSQRYLDEYKVKEQEVIGKHHYEVFPDLPQKWRDVHKKALQGEVSSAEDDPYEKEDGTIEWTRWECRPWFEADGTIGGLIVYTEVTTERKRVEESLRRRNVELEALLSVSSALRSADNLEAMLPILLDQTLAILNTTAGAIWLFHPFSEVLRYTVARGWYRQLEDVFWQKAGSITGKVFQTGEPHLSADLNSDPLVDPILRISAAEGWNGAYLPVKSGDLTVGVIAVSMRQPREITGEELRLLNSLTEMAGIAIHRLGLHEETNRRLRQLQALTTIDRAINTSFDLRVTLNVLLEQVLTQLNVDTAAVFLMDPFLKTLKFKVGLGFQTAGSYESISFKPGEGAVGRAALERKTVFYDKTDQAQCSQCPQLFYSESFAGCIALPLIVKAEVKGVLAIYLHKPFHPDSDWLSFAETLAGQAAIAVDSAGLFESLQQSNLELSDSYDSTIEGWARALDLRDNETEGHSRRVTDMVINIASRANMPDSKLVHVRRGALLHDIGKVGIPDSILLKPGSLSPEEWVIMKKHPQLAYDLLSPIEYLRPALDIPYCHHEKYDGTGYPRGLSGEEIPLAARIFAVVDVYDALTSDRPYRKAWTAEKALELIRSESGKHFDPQVVEIFLQEIVK